MQKKKKKKNNNNNANLAYYGISITNLESAILDAILIFLKIPQSDTKIFYNIFRWWNVHQWCILQIVKHGYGQIRN